MLCTGITSKILACLLLLMTSLSQVQGQLEVRYLLEEEKPPGTFIGNVIYDASLTSHYGADVLRQLQFKFMKQPAVDITVEMETGALRTSGRVDREQVCPSAGVCDIRVDLLVQPMKYFQIIKVSAFLFLYW